MTAQGDARQAEPPPEKLYAIADRYADSGAWLTPNNAQTLFRNLAREAYALGLAAGGGAAREQIAQWVEIGEAVTAFLDCIEWTEHSTEDDACNLKHRIDVALLAVSEGEK